MQVVVARDVHQTCKFFTVVFVVVFVPQLDEPHHITHQRAEGGDGTKGAEPHARAEGVQKAEAQDTQLFVQVLHGDGTARTHEVVTAVLQQRIHGHHQKAAESAQQNQEGRGHPDVGDEIQQDHQHAHANAQGHDQGGVFQAHAQACCHRPHRRFLSLEALRSSQSTLAAQYATHPWELRAAFFAVYLAFNQALTALGLSPAQYASVRLLTLAVPVLSAVASFTIWQQYVKTVLVQRQLSARNAELMYLAQHDPLTGLYNRRHFAVEAAADAGQLLSVVAGRREFTGRAVTLPRVPRAPRVHGVAAPTSPKGTLLP
mgnify:CR=1 FL=1